MHYYKYLYSTKFVVCPRIPHVNTTARRRHDLRQVVQRVVFVIRLDQQRIGHLRQVPVQVVLERRLVRFRVNDLRQPPAAPTARTPARELPTSNAQFRIVIFHLALVGVGSLQLAARNATEH